MPAGSSAWRGSAAGHEHVFCCFGCYLAFRVQGEPGEEAEATLFMMRVGVGSFLSMNVMMLSILLYSHGLGAEDAGLRRGIELVVAALATPAMLILGVPLLRDAWLAARHGRITAETMVALSSCAAYGFSIVALVRGLDRVYFDTATMLLLLFTVGRYLDAAVRARAARDLSSLLEAELATATAVTSSGEVRKTAFELSPGDLVRVGPGERIPVDGEIIEGASEVDQALVTGESRPVPRAVGDSLFAGTVNGDGHLLVKTTAAGAATHWAEIGRAVKEALQRRSHLHSLTERISVVFLPLVLLLALAVGIHRGRSATAWEATSVALAILVVACPCALGPAAYLASFLGIGMAAKRGVVVRSSRALQDLAMVSCVAFDKTGCLTRGVPALVATACAVAPEVDLLGRAARLAASSDHPLARALAAEARARGLAVNAASDVETRRGRGLCGRQEGVQTALGSLELFRELGWRVPQPLARSADEFAKAAHSVTLFGSAGEAEGVFAFSDQIRQEARGVLGELRARGLRSSILSGDQSPAVRRVAESLAIDSWRAELSPHDKLEEARALMARERAVAMIGDGLNDGPALAGASVGIALGSGTELARTSAEIVTADADLRVLPWLIDLSRAVRRKTIVNLAWAFGYNIVGVGVAAAGHLQPIFAAGLMAASSIVVVGNSLALSRGRWQHDPPVPRHSA